MPPFDDQNPRYSGGSDSSDESDFDYENWFRNQHADANATALAPVPYGPMRLGKQNDWLQPMNGAPFDDRSCIPSRRTPGKWRMTDLTRYGYPGSVQGWKLHIGCHPQDYRAFFRIMTHYLVHKNVPHKFLPFSSMNHAIGRQVDYKDGEGKSCVIYPKHPRALRDITLEVESLIRRENAGHILAQIQAKAPTSPLIRPYPGGVKGDLKIGRTGFVGTRYGAFTGPLADKKDLYSTEKGKLFDPFAKTEVSDPRLLRPYPAFASNIPIEIRGLM